MKNKKIILITGKKRSGKDTVSMMMNAQINNSEIMSFAEPMKVILSKLYGITIEQLNYSKDNGRIKAFLKYGNPLFLFVNFRKKLQLFGSEIMKPIFGEDIWVKALINKMNNSKAEVIIVSDWRFLIERYKGAVTIRINKDGLPNIDSHSSENELNNVSVDYTVENNGSLSDLNNHVYKLTKELGY